MLDNYMISDYIVTINNQDIRETLEELGFLNRCTKSSFYLILTGHGTFIDCDVTDREPLSEMSFIRKAINFKISRDNIH